MQKNASLAQGVNVVAVVARLTKKAKNVIVRPLSLVKHKLRSDAITDLVECALGN